MKNLLLPLLLAISLYSFGQSGEPEENRIYLKLYGGRALPQGEFSEKTSVYNSGFAEKGIVGGFTLGKPISKSTQVDFDLLRASYKVDEGALFNAYFQQLIVQVQKQNPNKEVKSSISTGSYINTNAFASLKLSLIENEFKLYAKPGIGISWFSVPSFNESLKIGVDEFLSNSTYETATSFMFNLSAGIEYKLNQDVFLDFNFQYLFSEFKVEGSLYAEDQNGEVYFYEETVNYDFATVNLTLGLVFYIRTNSTAK